VNELDLDAARRWANSVLASTVGTQAVDAPARTILALVAEAERLRTAVKNCFAAGLAHADRATKAKQDAERLAEALRNLLAGLDGVPGVYLFGHEEALRLHDEQTGRSDVG
jgi:hypothetical protein